jgi:hypothetical protein
VDNLVKGARLKLRPRWPLLKQQLLKLRDVDRDPPRVVSTEHLGPRSPPLFTQAFARCRPSRQSTRVVLRRTKVAENGGVIPIY